MEDKWLTWAKQLQAIAATGLHFTESQYDRDRYQQVASIALAMLSMLGNASVRRIERLVPEWSRGYATPKVDVRGAVLRGDKVLLVREAIDGLWTMPGGYADVGFSPAENVAKEIEEEASISVRVKSLYSVRHKAKHEYDQDVRDFYKLFFLCEQVDDREPKPGTETTDAAFFALDELPPLSTGRVLPSDIEAALSATADRVTTFD